MNWWKKKEPVERQSQPREKAELPQMIEVVPGVVTAKVYSIEQITSPGETISCWCYLSSGLNRIGQKEVLFTIKRESTEDALNCPVEPLQFIQAMHHFAQNNQFVDAGGTTMFGPKGFIDAKFGGILYEEHVAENLAAPVPPGVLDAVVVTQAEVAVAQRFGTLRVLSLLGEKERYFPFPHWLDRRRTSVVTEEMLQQMHANMVTNVPTMRVAGSRCLKINDRLIFKLPAARKSDLTAAVQQMPPDMGAFAVQLSMDPTADACLVWQPVGAQEPRAIGDSRVNGGSAPGTDSLMPRSMSLSGCFITLINADEQSRFFISEDGFALILDSPDWKRITTAFGAGQDATLSLSDGMKVEIKWE